MSAHQMTDLDRELLNAMQKEFPIAARPYKQLGELFDLSEDDTVAAVRRLKDEAKIIRQISPIFDTRALGYRSALVAMKVAPDHLLKAAKIVNEHPGVSHNYQRNHPFNMWFTVACESDSKLGVNGTIDMLHKLAGAERTIHLPTLRLFKIGMKLDLTGKTLLDKDGEEGFSDKDREHAAGFSISEEDREFIRVMQDDLPVSAEPYKERAERLEMSQEDLFAKLRDMQDKSQMRRVAAILYHRRAGFRENVMGVWSVPEQDIMRVGPIMAQFQSVSHCYQRPVYPPDWNYSMYTMVHGKNRDECVAILETIRNETGVEEMLPLRSEAEFKKIRLPYFVDDYRQWEERALAATA